MKHRPSPNFNPHGKMYGILNKMSSIVNCIMVKIAGQRPISWSIPRQLGECRMPLSCYWKMALFFQQKFCYKRLSVDKIETCWHDYRVEEHYQSNTVKNLFQNGKLKLKGQTTSFGVTKWNHRQSAIQNKCQLLVSYTAL